ncbi:MAG TPA: radical SAM protein [Thermoanaerobaculaceae bacterium]|nr:radical SAM protein [Thermoanaerobaculaceae bacterium]HPS78358.1 radical SAM protein [Thermoanaerobaculaceae bacterium]
MARRAVPVNVRIELTSNCNLRCGFCYKHRSGNANALSLSAWGEVLGDLRTLGALSVAFTGGEPLLYPQAIELMRLARGMGYAVHLLTNGTLLGNDEADDLAEIYPASVEISLHGASAPVHDAATGVSGSFDAAMAACARLRERRVKLVLKTPLTLDSEPELEAIGELARDWGVPWRLSSEILPAEDGHREALVHSASAATIQHLAQVMPVITAAPAASGQACGVGRTTVAIDPEGNVFPCLRWRHSSMGNLRFTSIAEIWRNSALRIEAAEAANAASAWLAGDGRGTPGAQFCPALAIRYAGSVCARYPSFALWEQILGEPKGND